MSDLLGVGAKLETWYGFWNSKFLFVSIWCRTLQWGKLPGFNAFPVYTINIQDSGVFLTYWILIGQFTYVHRHPKVTIRVACAAGGISPTSAFGLVAKPWMRGAKPWEDSSYAGYDSRNRSYLCPISGETRLPKGRGVVVQLRIWAFYRALYKILNNEG